MDNTILVTGGAGYIGSHTCVELLENGYEVVVIDNLSNSSKESLVRVEQITGTSLSFVEGDLLDKPTLDEVIRKNQPDTVIHFAGLKAVGESVNEPAMYYMNNVGGTAVLLRSMQEAGVKNIVFSSSCTVYGEPKTSPITEDFPVGALNPYGHTKLVCERMLRDQYVADGQWNISILRYFNPIGAHSSGRIGEDPKGVPNCLVPYISQVAVGKLKELSVWGGDYPTPDGTCVRDYIHVVDLARGHLSALTALAQKPGVITHNLGTGRGYSVLEVIAAFERASGVKIDWCMAGKRSGDAVSLYADPARALEELGWQAEQDLDQMCADAYRWQKENPEGLSQ